MGSSGPLRPRRRQPKTAPVLLGGGVRLYGGEGDAQIELQRVSLGEAEQLTDLRLRVV
jgi:hypothetical protein